MTIHASDVKALAFLPHDKATVRLGMYRPGFLKTNILKRYFLGYETLKMGFKKETKKGNTHVVP